MSDNDESPTRDFGDSLQLTNWILDAGATFHMTPQVSDFIPGSSEDTDKHIEVVGRNHVAEKQKGRYQIKICINTGNPFIATLQNILLAPDLCDRLFSIITLMNLVHNCSFRKGFCTVYFGDKKKSTVTLLHSAQRKHALLVKIKSKSTKLAPWNKVALELLHHRLVHRSTRSLMAVDTANVWKDIKPRIYPDAFFTSCQISSMNKKARSKNPLNPKATFK